MGKTKPKLNRTTGTPKPRTPPKSRTQRTPSNKSKLNGTTNTTNGTTTVEENKKGLAKFAEKHEKTLTAVDRIGKGASALDPLTDSRNRPSSTGSALSDPGADRNPYAVVRGDSDVLTKRERKKLDSYTA